MAIFWTKKVRIWIGNSISSLSLLKEEENGQNENMLKVDMKISMMMMDAQRGHLQGVRQKMYMLVKVEFCWF